MRALKQLGFKLIVILCIMATFFCFVVNTPVCLASKVKTDSFYYSGTSKGSYTVQKSFLERLVDALGAILDYMLGIMTMGLRIVFVGWTALLEQILTWLLEGATGTEVNVQDVEAVGLANPDDYITVQAIVFNKVFLFNINVFDFEIDDTHDSLGKDLAHDAYGNEIPEEDRVKSDITEDSFVNVLKQTIAGWYYTFRLISLMVMLILLIYIGIKLAIASSVKQKALYKQVLMDWVVGTILVFSIHYIILAMISFNEMMVSEISKMNIGYKGEKAVYEYGIKDRGEKEISNEELEISVYDEVRTRAYDAKLTVGTVGMVLYMILVYYAWKFSFMYLKRYLVVAVLIMMAPFVAVSYAYNKVRSGKTPIFTNWLKELFFMIILQSIHALLYVIFFRQAIAMSLSSIGGMILAFVILHFISNAEEIFKKIFNINGKLTNDVAGSKLQDIGKMVSSASLGVASSKTAAKMTKGAARIASKPARLAANYGFGKIMEHRANRFDRQEKENEEKIANGEEDKVKPTSLQKKKANRIQRENQLKLGDMAFKLPDKKENLSKKERDALLKLKETIPLVRESSNEIIEDDEGYIDKFYKNKDMYMKNYKRVYLANNVANKWNEIMNPYQYVKRQSATKDENGNIIKGKYKRKKNEYQNENWGPILKHLSKKQDGVGKVFSKYNFNYIFNISKSDVKAVMQFYKTCIVGFAGVLVGLPLAIVEPEIGSVFLAKGISENHKVFGGHNRAKMRNLRSFALDYKGNYHLVGYNAKAVDTMANGMQAYAREGFNNYVESVEEHNRQVRRNVRKHKKLYENVRFNGNPANMHLRDSFRITSNPVRAFTTIATGNVLTGHLYQNLRMNAFLMYHEYKKEALRKNAKELEKDYKSTDAFLNHMADKYNEVEAQKQELVQERLSKKIENTYSEAINLQINNVDKMTDEQLLVELGDFEEITIETNIDGKKQLSGNSERNIIDKSIVEVIQKSGIINIEEYDLEKDSAKVQQVKKVITDKLIQQGAISRTESASDIIVDLDKKIIAQKQKIQKDNPTAVQDKLIDDAILSEIKDVPKGEKVDPKSIDSNIISEKVGKSIVNVPTEQSSNVVSAMNNGNETENAKKSSVSPITKQAIESRKAIIASKLERNLSADERKASRERVKQQKLHDLDVEIISALSVGNSNGDNNEENDSLSSHAQTQSVLELLKLNTEREKAKKQLLEVSQSTKEQKRKMYLSSLYNSDGIINSKKLASEIALVDGSRKAVNSYNSRIDENIGNSDVLEIMKRVRSQKNI